MMYGRPADNFNKMFTESELRASMPTVDLPNDLTDINLDGLGFVCLEAPLHDVTTPVADSNHRLGNSVALNDEGGYVRTIIQIPINEEDKPIRVMNRWHSVRAKRDKLLLESDRHGTLDFNLQSTEWLAYRALLRDITDDVTDPFSIVFPTPPNIRMVQTLATEEGLRFAIKARIKKMFAEKLSARPAVDTGLGYSVDGGKHDIENLSLALDVGATTIRDSAGAYQTVDSATLSTIVTTIKQNRVSIIQAKWASDDALEALTDINLLRDFDKMIVREHKADRLAGKL